jgi:hypothetical protein
MVKPSSANLWSYTLENIVEKLKRFGLVPKFYYIPELLTPSSNTALDE